MNNRTALIFLLLLTYIPAFSQIADTINAVDKNGMKQGQWIKKFPNGHIQYNGYFRDNHPVNTFKRFYNNDTIQSVMIFSPDGKEASAIQYFANGYIASEGKFRNQFKEGKWKFYSNRIRGYMICEEEYLNNLKYGPSVKFYSDGSVAERLNYVNDLKNGEWVQYFPNNTLCLKGNYVMGKLDGNFEVFYDNGKPEYIGQYKADSRNGKWQMFNPDGTLKYIIDYVYGVASDSEKYKKESEYLDALEKNKGKFADPEKTGTIWQ